MSRQNITVDGLLTISPSHQKMSSAGDKFKSSSSSLLQRNSGRRAKHLRPTSSTGDLRLSRCSLRSKFRSSFKEEEEDDVEQPATSAGHLIVTPLARAPSTSNPTLKNETWDEAVTTSSAPKRAASFKLMKHAWRRSVISNDDRSSDCSQSLPGPEDKISRLKPALVSDTDTTARSKAKAVKHVHFADMDIGISYEVTDDDIKNSWLDIDVSSALESTMDRTQHMVVSFGPTGRYTSSNIDLCKNGKDYMVLIQQPRLINEMLGQRTNLRRSVLTEQARQKREGVVDAQRLHAVASEHSKWGVEIAKSSWWLHMSSMT